MADPFQTVATVAEVVEGRGFPVDVDGYPVALFFADGSYYAIEDTCPHQGAPLCDGEVVGKSVTCNWHGWRFSIEDGRRLDSSRGKVKSYQVRVVGDEIQVALTSS